MENVTLGGNILSLSIPPVATEAEGHGEPSWESLPERKRGAARIGNQTPDSVGVTGTRREAGSSGVLGQEEFLP